MMATETCHKCGMAYCFDGTPNHTAECPIGMEDEIRRLRTEKRRWRGWLRKWRSEAAKANNPYRMVFVRDMDAALRGEPPPKKD